MPDLTPAQVAAVAPAAPVVTETPSAAPAAVTDPAAAAAAAAEQAAEDAFAGLPEEFSWLKAEVKGLRQESGGYRTKLREQEELFKNAVTAEDHAAAVEASRKGFAELTLKDALREHKLPEGAAALIQGATPEDTYARAAALAAVIGGAPAPVVPVTPVTPVDQLHAGFGPQGGSPKPLSGREVYRLKHKRN